VAHSIAEAFGRLFKDVIMLPNTVLGAKFFLEIPLTGEVSVFVVCLGNQKNANKTGIYRVNRWFGL